MPVRLGTTVLEGRIRHNWDKRSEGYIERGQKVREDTANQLWWWNRKK